MAHLHQQVPPTMKAARWDPHHQKITITTIPTPTPPPPNHLLVKTHSASLCHSDLQHALRPTTHPITLGHEAVGHIVAAHPSVHTSTRIPAACTPAAALVPGTPVGFNYFTGCCFECEGCLVHNLRCERAKEGEGIGLQGFGVDGFFAEWAVVDARSVVVLPEGLLLEGEGEGGGMERCAPLFCAGITAYHSVRSCELGGGEWLAVVGCGGLGQYAVRYARAMGIKTIGIDINDTQLAQAKKAGADAVFNSKTDKNYLEEVRKLTGKGCHAAAVYSASNAAYASAPDLLRTGGLLMVVGIAPKGLDFINTFDLTTGRYRIKAESTSIPQRMGEAVAFTGKHGITPEVEFRKLEDLPDMCAEMEAGKAEKRQVVVF